MFQPSPHPRRPSLIVPVAIDREGVAGPTRGVARGRGWRRSTHGLYVPAAVLMTSQQRTLEAAATLAEDEAVTGWAALDWRGGRWFGGQDSNGSPLDVPVVAARHRLAQPGFSVSQEFLHPGEIEAVDGLRVTTALRSVVFEMRYAASLDAAVVALDMACYSDFVSLAEVTAYVAALGPVTGIQQARDALVEGEENSWSPQETKMRGVWIRRAGLPRPLCNRPVFTPDGTHVGTPDVIDPELGLIGQYNGSEHLSVAGAATDTKQDAAYRDLGLECVTMLASDWLNLDAFVDRLVRAAQRARDRTRPPGWRVVPPDWWTPTHTVATRRELADWQRERYLRYRRAS